MDGRKEKKGGREDTTGRSPSMNGVQLHVFYMNITYRGSGSDRIYVLAMWPWQVTRYAGR
jgi:hypothetical protein